MHIKRRYSKKEKEQALLLAWKVFEQCNAPLCEERGIENFQSFLKQNSTLQMLYYGAYIHHELCGMLAVRHMCHISLFFVSAAYQKQGIGSSLFHGFLREYRPSWLSVNAAPYALHVYKNLGFRSLHQEMTKDGIRFTPMFYKDGLHEIQNAKKMT